MIEITGNTYSVRHQLKSLGCKWNAARRAWFAPTQEIADQAQALVKPSKGGGRRGPRLCAGCRCHINYGVYCGKCEFGR